MWVHRRLANKYLPRNGDFIAASTMPTSSCKLLGSWARPEANAASASAWRPRYWRATPCRKYACRRREGRGIRAWCRCYSKWFIQTNQQTHSFHTICIVFFTWAVLWTLCIPIIEWSPSFFVPVNWRYVLHKCTCYSLAGWLSTQKQLLFYYSIVLGIFPFFF